MARPSPWRGEGARPTGRVGGAEVAVRVSRYRDDTDRGDGGTGSDRVRRVGVSPRWSDWFFRRLPGWRGAGRSAAASYRPPDGIIPAALKMPGRGTTRKL